VNFSIATFNRTDTKLSRKCEFKRSAPAEFCTPVTSRSAAKTCFALACEHDLEGIVAKHRFGPYLSDGEETS